MSEEFGFMRHADDDYEQGVPNLAKRNPERQDKPRAARIGSIDERLEQIRRDALTGWKQHG